MGLASRAFEFLAPKQFFIPAVRRASRVEGDAHLIEMAGVSPAMRPCNTLMPTGSGRSLFAAGAPDIDADEQEQPDHVDEVPVPGGELEAEMLGGRELAHV